MFIRHDTGRHRIIRSGVIKNTDDSAKNIDAGLGDGSGGTGGSGTNHTHSNKNLLDGLSLTLQNKLFVHGNPLSTHMHEEAW